MVVLGVKLLGNYGDYHTIHTVGFCIPSMILWKNDALSLSSRVFTITITTTFVNTVLVLCI